MNRKTPFVLALLLTALSAFGQTQTLDWSKIRNTPTNLAGYGVVLPNATVPCRYTAGTGVAQNCALGSGLSINPITHEIEVTAGGVGTVTEIVAGAGLIGGTITTAGTIAVDIGNSAGQVAAGDDPRLSDRRTPPDGAVLNVHIAPGAAIARSKLALPDDDIPGNASLRSLGLGAQQAAPGNTSVQKGDIATSGLTTTGPIVLGKTNAGAGPIVAIPLGANVAFSGGQLVGTGGSTTDASALTVGTLDPARQANSGVTSGIYGNASNIPVLTVDAKGRVTNATTVAAAGGSGSTPAVFSSPSSDCSADVSSAFNSFMTANSGAAILRAGCYRMDASLVKTSGGSQTTLSAYGDGPVEIVMTSPTVSPIAIDNTSAASAAVAVSSIATVTPPASAGGNPSDDYVDQITLATTTPATFKRGAQCVVYSDDMNVGEGTSPIIAMTATNPVRITLQGALSTSDYNNGDTVRINYATGYTALNSSTTAYTLGNRAVTATTTSFDLVGVNGIGAPAYTGGGYVGGGTGTGDSHGLTAEGFTIHSLDTGNKVNIYGRLQYRTRLRNNVQMRCLDETYKVKVTGITFTTRGAANTNSSDVTRAPFILLRGLVNPEVSNNQFEYPFGAAVRTEGSAAGHYNNNVTRYGINNPAIQQYTYGLYFYGVNFYHVVEGYTQQQGRHGITTDAIANANIGSVWYQRGVPHSSTFNDLVFNSSDGTGADEHPEAYGLVFNGITCNSPQKGAITVDSTITGSCIQSRSLNPIYNNVVSSGGTRGLSITQVDHGFPNKITVDGFTVRDLSSTLSTGGGGEWNDAAVDADSQAPSNAQTTLILRNMKCINVGTCIQAGIKNNVIVDGLYTWNTDTIAAVREGARVDFFGSQIYDYRAKNADGTVTLERSRYGTSATDANYACAIRSETSYGPGACYWHTQPKLFKETTFAPYAMLYPRTTAGGAIKYYLSNGIEENKDSGVTATLLNNGAVSVATDVSIAYASASGTVSSVTAADPSIVVGGSGSAVTVAVGTVPPEKGGSGPALNRSVILGDSITNANKSDSGSTVRAYNSRGYFTYLQYACNHCFEFNTSLNFGVSGYDQTNVIAQLPSIIAAKPDIAFILIGTNAVKELQSVATITSGLNTIYQTLGAAGIKVVAIPILPRSTWDTLTAPNIIIARNILNGVNNYIRTYNLLPTTVYKIIVADPSKYMVDPASATGDPYADQTLDGLHPSTKGHYSIFRAVYEQIHEILPKYSLTSFSTQSDAYDATYNPRGNLLTNGMLSGTGGSTGSGTSGTVAAGWALTRSGGSTITAVASKQAIGADGSAAGAQRIVVTTNGTGTVSEKIQLSQTTTTGFTTGNVVLANCLIAGGVLTGDNLIGTTLRLTTTGSASLNHSDMEPKTASELLPPIQMAGGMLTPPMTLPSGITALLTRIEFEMDGTKTGTAYLDVSRCNTRVTN